MTQLAAVPERRATFREKRMLAALTEPLLSSGRLRYRRPGFLEKDTDWPQPERLMVDGRWLSLSDGGNDPPRVIDLNGQPELRTLIDALRAPLAGDLTALEASFTLAGQGTLSSWTLLLQPRAAAAAKFLRSVQLTGRGDEILEIHVVQANGDEQWTQIEPQR